MQLNAIHKYAQKPMLYEKGTTEMWTDKHISKQLLQVHLNPEIDLASRKESTIKYTVDWMLNKVPNQPLKILDLGCGPGLYTTLLAEKGHDITGVDFSESSVEYARDAASKRDLSIKYLRENYLNMDFQENSFDLVILIYTDLGVLLPEERKHLIGFIYRILKPGGTFIFDVLNDEELPQKVTPKNWEIAESGFWKPEPYIALSESFLYEEEKVILYQHLVVGEQEKVDVYRFWTHFFSEADLQKLLGDIGFVKTDCYKNVLPGDGLFEGENVTFSVAIK